ncbi:rifampicin phosphotransferase-like [Dermacentor albipictus]|uniref:rifampicin phosphotransferase-like n=1 Tax=Dermacentor albipictus TaxID=60249 RepID=UPI0038FCFFD4
METAMSRLVNALEDLKMPADVQGAICDHISKFDKDTMFAVRSSALGEDSEDMSAAGQMTTVLGVRGHENVVSAVVKCWASQFSFTSVNYKRRGGPSSPSSSHAKLGKSPCALPRQVEKTYTTPQDIEWALRDGKFFMLQCRPVTTFFRESDCEMLHEFDEGIKSAKEVLTKGNVSEVLPGAASPLAMSLLRCGFEAHGKGTAGRFMYASSLDRSQYIPMWGPMHRYSYFLWLSDGLRKTGPDANIMEKSFMYSILGRDASEEVATGVKRTRTINCWKLPVQFYHIVKSMLTVSYGVESTSRKTSELRLFVDQKSTAAQIHDYMGRSLHHLREPATLLLKVSMSSSFYNAIIIHILSAARGALDAEVFSELAKILRGAEAESADVPRMIKELGQVIRESPEKEKFLKMTSEEACQWLSMVENECGKKYREFMKKHGHRAVKELDVYTKPWSLDPSSLVKSLKVAAASPQVEQKASSTSWDVSKVPHKLSTFQRVLLKFVAPKARAAVEAREVAKSAAVRVVHQLRLLCHQLSLRMVHEGRLPSPELLFFLTYEEIGILLRTRTPELVLKAQRRQKIYAVADKDLYPSIFVGIPKPIERIKRHVDGDFEIKGSPMSQGVVEGKVRAAPTFGEAHLIQKGEILVTTATDTGWTPYFPLLAGVVTEIGGPLSHGAVVAREYGLPCVVGIEGITTMLTSGDYIELDGNTGLVRKIPVPEAQDDGQYS